MKFGLHNIHCPYFSLYSHLGLAHQLMLRVSCFWANCVVSFFPCDIMFFGLLLSVRFFIWFSVFGDRRLCGLTPLGHPGSGCLGDTCKRIRCKPLVFQILLPNSLIFVIFTHIQNLKHFSLVLASYL